MVVLDGLQHSEKISDALKHSEKTSGAWQHCHENSAIVFSLLSYFSVASVFFCLAARLATCSGSMLRKRSLRFIVVEALLCQLSTCARGTILLLSQTGYGGRTRKQKQNMIGMLESTAGGQVPLLGASVPLVPWYSCRVLFISW